MNKKYYWLKLKEDFFRQKSIKKLRKIAGGDTYTVIYLKMLLRSLQNNGKLYYEGYEKDFASELALDIDEDEDNVRITIQYLTAQGILTENSSEEYELPECAEMTGSESASAARVREFRKRQTLPQSDIKALQCNTDVTMCNTEIEIEIEKETEKDIDIDKEKSKPQKRFAPPSVDEVRSYCRERNNSIDAERFVDYYQSKGWMIGKNKMKDWKAAVRQWERNNFSSDKPKAPEQSFYGADDTLPF